MERECIASRSRIGHRVLHGAQCQYLKSIRTKVQCRGWMDGWLAEQTLSLAGTNIACGTVSEFSGSPVITIRFLLF